MGSDYHSAASIMKCSGALLAIIFEEAVPYLVVSHELFEVGVALPYVVYDCASSV
jgi:hypothetical protein